MSKDFYIGIDVGTSSTKTGLWRADGVLIGEATAAYPLHRPQPTWAEMDPRDWWSAVCTTVHAVLAQSNVSAQDIAAVAVDAIGWSLVPVDAHGAPLCMSPIWLDRRADSQAASLRSSLAAKSLVELVANPLDAAYLTPKVLWLHEMQPDIYAQTHRFLEATGYIVHQLCSAFTCDYTQAYGYHCFDIRRERWDQDALVLLELPPDKFPTLHPSCTIVGEVTQAAAEATGLRTGTPVIAGALDASVGAFGSGVARVGQCSDQGGTAFGLSLCVDRVIVEPRLIFSHHVVPGTYIFQGGTVGGGVLRWFRETLGQPEAQAAALLDDDAYTLMSREAAQAAAGAGGLIFLPYMAGERSPLWNSDARGVFAGLTFNTSRAQIIRALMEGCAYAVYHNVQVMEAHGVRVGEWIGIGGAAKSEVWCQIKADLTGRPFVIAQRADGKAGDNTLGLAVMGMYAVGACSDLATQIEAFLPQRRVYEPDTRRHALYQEAFAVYLDLVERLRPAFKDLARIGQSG
ncbi:MAG: FGGY family carbohydrate kinase [Chloroflexota bacterium]|nr:FGGY family carbohydrate kinase [Chloroflexota bacterium]